ncbi:MAG: glycosyltransferase family 2 protein [Pyrinomonadaceae bacterium]
MSGFFCVSLTMLLMTLSVSIVIPNWNGRELLADYFGSVVAAAAEFRARHDAEVEVIVVDDASTDDSRDWVRANYGNHAVVRLIELENNVGFLRAVNRGFQEAKNDVVFLLNNDVKAEIGCIAPLLPHFADNYVFAVCCHAGRIDSDRLDGGGKLGSFERGFWRVFLNYDVLKSDEYSELISFFGSGGYTAYDRKKLEQIGGFQDCLAPIYWEDVEICYRAWKRGWKVIYEPDSRVAHKGSATMGKRARRPEMAIITERNRLLMTWINLHDKRMFASHLGRLTLKLIGSLISFRWSYLRSFGRALGNLSKVKQARSIEQKAAVITDRELHEKFAELRQQPGIYVLENEDAEIAFEELKKKSKDQA